MGLDLSELSSSVAARIPVRTNTDDRYFSDSFQKIPAEGYTRMFARMLDHRNIRVELGVDFREFRKRAAWNLLVYTGPIDEYFEFCFGRLPYRSLRFDHEQLPDTARFQSVGTVNYPNDHKFTRITEFKHLTGQQHPGTSIVREFPEAEGDPTTPYRGRRIRNSINGTTSWRPWNEILLFVGRLAEYRYYNMDQVVARALMVFEKIISNIRRKKLGVGYRTAASAR